MTNITPATLHTALYFRTFDSIGIEIEEEGREKSRSIIIVSLSTRMGGTCTRLNNVKKRVNVSTVSVVDYPWSFPASEEIVGKVEMYSWQSWWF